MFNKIWNILLYFIICIEIVLLVLFALPNLFGVKVFTVASGSMVPRYDIGSIVYVKKVGPKDIEIGDAITFYMQDTSSVATHEVYEINEDYVTFGTQGINNRDENGDIIHDANKITYDKIIGKVVFCIPGIGIIYNFVSNIPVLCVIMVITISMILISFFISKRKEKNVEK